MGVAEDMRAMSSDLVRWAGDGGTVTVRRRHTLKSQRRGTTSFSLVVNGAYLTGALTISMRADLLDGKLPKSCRFTIAGNATIYTVGADAEASGGAISVAFTPALAANAADGATVTLSTPYVDYSFYRSRGRGEVDVLDTGERQSSKVLHLSALTTSGEVFVPVAGDLVVDGSTTQEIKRVGEVNPGGVTSRWRLELGS